MTAGDSSMATRLPCMAKSTFCFGQSASPGFFERHVSYSKLRQSLCHARSAAESFSEVNDLAVPGHRRRIRGQPKPGIPGACSRSLRFRRGRRRSRLALGRPLGARLVTSIRALRTTTWLRSRVGSTTCSPEGQGVQYLRYVTQHFRIKLFLLETLQTVRPSEGTARHPVHIRLQGPEKGELQVWSCNPPKKAQSDRLNRRRFRCTQRWKRAEPVQQSRSIRRCSD
jgi:hypothetical protein